MGITHRADNIIITDDVHISPDIGGVGTVYFNYMKKYSSRIAQIETETDDFDTFDSLLQKCIRTAIGLQKRGIKKGDIIALYSDRHLNACVPIIAATFIGAIPCSLNHAENVEGNVRYLKQITPKVIFAMKNLCEMLNTAIKESGVKTEVVVFGESFEKDFLIKHGNEENFMPIFVKDLKETAQMCFTSGSTGLAKAVCLSHYYLICSNGKLIEDRRRSFTASSVENPVFLSYTGWFWITSLMYTFYYTTIGGCKIITPSYNSEDLWKFVEKFKVTDIGMGPFEYMELSSSIRPPHIDVSSLKVMMTFGTSLAKEFFFAIRKMLPHTTVFQLYGISESGWVASFDSNNELDKKYLTEHPDSCGLPVKGIWYKVVDPDTEEILGSYKPGELRLKTKQVMNGYYRQDSSENFDKDGWFKTGDVVYYDNNFCFYIVARRKDRLYYRHWRIYPKQLEEVLHCHPAVKVAIVVGKPNKDDIEHLTGVVILKEDAANVTSEELRIFADERVQDYQKLRGGVILVKKFPLTPTGKINRRQLTKMVIEGVI